MAEPGKAKRVLGDNYPITINNLRPDVTSCECGPGDLITLTATVQSCVVFFQGCAVGVTVETTNTAGVALYANEENQTVHWGVEAYTPGQSRGPLGGGTTPYRIHIGSTDGGASQAK